MVLLPHSRVIRHGRTPLTIINKRSEGRIIASVPEAGPLPPLTFGVEERQVRAFEARSWPVEQTAVDPFAVDPGSLQFLVEESRSWGQYSQPSPSAAPSQYPHLDVAPSSSCEILSVVGGSATVADGGGVSSLATRCWSALKRVWETDSYDPSTGHVALVSRQGLQTLILIGPAVIGLGVVMAALP